MHYLNDMVCIVTKNRGPLWFDELVQSHVLATKYMRLGLGVVPFGQ